MSYLVWGVLEWFGIIPFNGLLVWNCLVICMGFVGYNETFPVARENFILRRWCELF